MVDFGEQDLSQVLGLAFFHCFVQFAPLPLLVLIKLTPRLTQSVAPAPAFKQSKQSRISKLAVTHHRYLRLLRKERIEPLEHFEDKRGGIYLNEAGRKTLIPLLETRLEEETEHPLGMKRPFRGMIELQAQRLAAAVEGRDTYVGFYPKR